MIRVDEHFQIDPQFTATLEPRVARILKRIATGAITHATMATLVAESVPGGGDGTRTSTLAVLHANFPTQGHLAAYLRGATGRYLLAGIVARIITKAAVPPPIQSPETP
jgi:hypothetical protein